MNRIELLEDGLETSQTARAGARQAECMRARRRRRRREESRNKLSSARADELEHVQGTMGAL